MTATFTPTNGTCALCRLPFEMYGHNPEPILPHDRRVCDTCNAIYVIPVRLGQMTAGDVIARTRHRNR